jgi:hypothetical protein
MTFFTAMKTFISIPCLSFTSSASIINQLHFQFLAIIRTVVIILASSECVLLSIKRLELIKKSPLWIKPHGTYHKGKWAFVGYLFDVTYILEDVPDVGLVLQAIFAITCDEHLTLRLIWHLNKNKNISVTCKKKIYFSHFKYHFASGCNFVEKVNFPTPPVAEE